LQLYRGMGLNFAESLPDYSDEGRSADNSGGFVEPRQFDFELPYDAVSET